MGQRGNVLRERDVLPGDTHPFFWLDGHLECVLGPQRADVMLTDRGPLRWQCLLPAFYDEHSNHFLSTLAHGKATRDRLAGGPLGANSPRQLRGSVLPRTLHAHPPIAHYLRLR